MITFTLTVQNPSDIGDFSDAPNGITVADTGETTVAFSAEGYSWSHYAITLAIAVTGPMLIEFLKNVFKKRSKNQPKYITVNDRKIPFEPKAIREFLKEEIGKEKQKRRSKKPKK